MKKLLFISIFLISNLFAQDTNLMVKQKKALYIQNMIDLEERIAFEYEKYLLTEFKIPTIKDLMSSTYLGSNFSQKNMMSSSKLISFKDAKNLKIKFAIDSKAEDYLLALYKRDLYRDRTSVKIIKNNNNLADSSLSYVKITLQSEEAKTIHSILLDNKTILKSCENDNKINKYCNKNINTLRWHFEDSSWIEYSKKDFNLGNVTLRNVSKTHSKLNDLAVGRYIYIENGPKYVKTINNTILKVE